MLLYLRNSFEGMHAASSTVFGSCSPRVCMYVCMYVYTYVCMYVCMDTLCIYVMYVCIVHILYILHSHASAVRSCMIGERSSVDREHAGATAPGLALLLLERHALVQY